MRLQRYWLLMMLVAFSQRSYAELLFLDVYINRWNSGVQLMVEQQQDQLLLDAQPLRQLLPNLPIATGDRVDINNLPLQDYRYDSSTQRLYLTIEEQYLPLQRIRQQIQRQQQIPYSQADAVWLNYDAVADKSLNSSDYLTGLNLDFNSYWQGWQFNHQHILRYSDSDGYSNVRLNTTLQFDDNERTESWLVGDFVTRSPSWARSYRVAGISWGKQYALRPDLVTHPLPNFSGSAAVPSTTDLFINGLQRASSDFVPGPFSIETQPFISGAGVATLVSTDMFGRTTQIEQPFYVSRTLLADGLTDYNFSLGYLRDGFTESGSNYQPNPVLNASYRYGVNNMTTLGSYLESDHQYANIGIEWQQLLGRWGEIAIAYRQGLGNSDGHTGTISYEYISRRFSVGVRHSQRNASFDDVLSAREGTMLPEQTSQANLTYNWQRYGAASIAYIRQRGSRFGDNELYTASYSYAPSRDWAFFISASKDVSNGAYAISLNISVQLDSQNNLTVTQNSDTGDSSYQRYRYSHGNDNYRGWRYSVSQTTGLMHNQTQGLVNWQGDNFQAYLGGSGQADDYRLYSGVRGGVIGIAGDTWLTRPVSQSFALVSSDSAAMPVYLSNHLVGETNEDGQLLVPELVANLPNKVSIDPLGLPADHVITDTEKWVRPAGMTGVHIHFDVEQIQPALLAVRLDTGETLPISSIVGNAEQQTISGWQGLVYLAQQPQQSQLAVELPDGRRCLIDLSQVSQFSQVQANEVTCHLVKRSRP
ncbi:fimbria/pilus outer membrane usher protein [Idiomarina xiamenensis]|uniref:Type I pili usher protein CsuD n=1 Tax=Idiomarina xiamenensis 10-D-4 TaxID=740709 RepID=K2KWT7_9GAMM|nr:fimbria/pilus outer membrane usher protein [Idiomarina xiamenensis]EKE82115.1 type I pili usher protein CsuD [Idiomarina xiamenensis 10-D-4]